MSSLDLLTASYILVKGGGYDCNQAVEVLGFGQLPRVSKSAPSSSNRGYMMMVSGHRIVYDEKVSQECLELS